MSTNIHLVVDDYEIDLWQTPSYATSMCMIDDDGVYHHKLSGKKAKAAVARYLEWVRGRASGAFSSVEEADDARAVVEAHIQTVQNAVECGKRVVVYAV